MNTKLDQLLFYILILTTYFQLILIREEDRKLALNPCTFIIKKISQIRWQRRSRLKQKTIQI